jgi:hypothetical protein
LFFVSGAKEDVESRTQYAEEAAEGVAKALGVDKFDTLILSLPGIILEKDEEDYNSKTFPVPDETKLSWVATWKVYQYVSLLTLDNRVVEVSWQSRVSRSFRVRHYPIAEFSSACQSSS